MGTNQLTHDREVEPAPPLLRARDCSPRQGALEYVRWVLATDSRPAVDHLDSDIAAASVHADAIRAQHATQAD